jgi:hypothetical protein
VEIWLRTQGYDLADKRDMTSTFATQFASGSPKGICGIMEEVRRRLKQGKVKPRICRQST